MTDYKTRRDEAAEAYIKEQDEIGQFNLRHIDQPDQSFQSGANWATAHWLEQVRVLTEALKSVVGLQKKIYGSLDKGDTPFSDCARDASNALTKWAELTKQNETKE